MSAWPKPVPSARSTVRSVRSRCQRLIGSLTAKWSNSALAMPKLPSAFSKSIGLTLCGMVELPTSPALTACLKYPQLAVRVIAEVDRGVEGAAHQRAGIVQVEIAPARGHAHCPVQRPRVQVMPAQAPGHGAADGALARAVRPVDGQDRNFACRHTLLPRVCDIRGIL